MAAALFARAIQHGKSTSSQGRQELLLSWRHLATVSSAKFQTGYERTSPDAVRTARQRSNARSADRDFFFDVLNVNATRRDAKQYLSRFDDESKKAKQAPKPTTHSSKTTSKHKTATGVNLGALYTTPVAVQHAPTFEQAVPGSTETEVEALGEARVALVSLRALDRVEDYSLDKIALTLSQLIRLDMRIIITFDVSDPPLEPPSNIQQYKSFCEQQGERLVRVLNHHNKAGACYLDSMIDLEAATDMHYKSPIPRLPFDRPLWRAIGQRAVPVIPPIAYTNELRAVPVKRSSIMRGLTKHFVGASTVGDTTMQSQFVDKALLERIIMIDPLGGIPSRRRADGSHVFINAEQEHKDIVAELSSSTSVETEATSVHIDNLKTLKDCLALLPPAASALIVSPNEAASSSGPTTPDTSPGVIRTRRQKNPLIHNLLTNRPVVSSSLPSERLAPATACNELGTNSASRATMVKRGMPLMIIPNPSKASWHAPTSGYSDIPLLDHPDINMPRLTALIEDSFRRKLDIKHYLERIQSKVAGIIVAGEYEGGAILTWESPPGSSNDPRRLVPYLDKFAVLQKSQGNAGVADIVFQAMTRSCFPNGVCWRSRSDNPVNKWYFERSAGSWKLPGGQWTMFWTLPGKDLVLDSERWQDYVAVCQGVVPSWADGKRAD